MKNLKIAFATEVTYPNYCNRLKKSALKYFFNYDLIDKDVHYYISTNMVSEFDGYDDINNIHVYNVEDLRDDPLSAKYELLPKDPIGLYPSKYPWNLRRYIIQKAAEDGFNYIIYIDADNVFHPMETDKFYDELLAAYEPNIVATNQTIFKYENKKPDDVFQYHDIYIDHFKTNFGVDDHDTIDGPVQVFMGDTNEDIIRFTKYWTKLSLFGYEKPLGVGYENNKHGNLSFVIPMSNFKLKWKSFPFYPNHVFSDRY